MLVSAIERQISGKFGESSAIAFVFIHECIPPTPLRFE
jgi:hypothetical protein